MDDGGTTEHKECRGSESSKEMELADVLDNADHTVEQVVNENSVNSMPLSASNRPTENSSAQSDNVEGQCAPEERGETNSLVEGDPASEYPSEKDDDFIEEDFGREAAYSQDGTSVENTSARLRQEISQKDVEKALYVAQNLRSCADYDPRSSDKLAIELLEALSSLIIPSSLVGTPPDSCNIPTVASCVHFCPHCNRPVRHVPSVRTVAVQTDCLPSSSSCSTLLALAAPVQLARKPLSTASYNITTATDMCAPKTLKDLRNGSWLGLIIEERTRRPFPYMTEECFMWSNSAQVTSASSATALLAVPVNYVLLQEHARQLKAIAHRALVEPLSFLTSSLRLFINGSITVNAMNELLHDTSFKQSSLDQIASPIPAADQLLSLIARLTDNQVEARFDAYSTQSSAQLVTDLHRALLQDNVAMVCFNLQKLLVEPYAVEIFENDVVKLQQQQLASRQSWVVAPVLSIDSGSVTVQLNFDFYHVPASFLCWILDMPSVTLMRADQVEDAAAAGRWWQSLQHMQMAKFNVLGQIVHVLRERDAAATAELYATQLYSSFGNVALPYVQHVPFVVLPSQCCCGVFLFKRRSGLSV